MTKRILVIGDSVSFHGPKHASTLDDPRLWANIAAAGLGWEADIYGRVGWTAREAWWAMKSDPYLTSVLIPRADVIVLALGNFDHLPQIVPSYLREGLSRIRPGSVRRAARKAYSLAQSYGVRVTRDLFRVLPQAAVDRYLSRCVQAIRTLHPHIQLIGWIPYEHHSRYYGFVLDGHDKAVAAAIAWGELEDIPLINLDELVSAHMHAGLGNADGMHWGWESHQAVGEATEKLIRNLSIPE
jgi:hypothetical protein